MPQQKPTNVAYGAQTPQPPIFGQQQAAQPPQADPTSQTEALLRLISLLRGGGGLPAGGTGALTGGGMKGLR